MRNNIINTLSVVSLLILSLILIPRFTYAEGAYHTGWGCFGPTTDLSLCNFEADYGDWDKNSCCMVVWDGVEQSCSEENRDGTIGFGADGEIIQRIYIEHLDRAGELTDGFEVKDGNKKICAFEDAPSTIDTWRTLECDVTLYDLAIVTIHPTARTPSNDCDIKGQIAIRNVNYDFVPASDVPEFSLATISIALIGALLIFTYKRRNQ